MTAMASFPVAEKSEGVEFVELRLRLREMPALVMATLSTPITNEELMQFSMANEPYRVERNADGDLEIMSPQGGKGARGESYLIRMLDEWAERNGGASFSSQCGFHLADGSVRMADAAWVEESRWNSLSEAEKVGYPPLCPDFLIELLSPSDSRAVLEHRMEAWLKNGTKLAWLIDPRAGEAVIYFADREPVCLVRPEAVQAKEVVAELRIEMSRFWT